MDRQTHQLQDACRSFVRTHIPDEVELFDTVWSSFWSMLPATSLAALSELPSLAPSFEGVFELGAVDGSGELDTLSVVGCLVDASAQVARSKKDASAEGIQQALETAIRRHQTPAHLRSLLREHATRLLAGIFSVEAPLDAVTPGSRPEQVWVERCEPTDTELARIQTCFEDEPLVEEIWGRRNDYALFVNELVPTLLVYGKPPSERPEPQHERFLGQVLETFRTRAPLSYDEVARRSLAENTPEAPGVDGRLRNLKYELNQRLEGVINEVLRADGSKKQYVLKAQVPYCWIRASSEASILF